jgi:TonB-linked SusC/RagA family outer membrane protein
MRRLGVQLACLIAALVYGFTPSEGMAQQGGTIEGRVVDGATGRPLPTTQVILVGTARGTLSDQAGRFRLENVPAGPRDVRAERVGYASGVQSVTVEAGAVASVTIELRQSVVDLQEIVVTGVAAGTERAKLPFTVDRLTAADIQVPSGNPVSALQGKLPGVTVVQGTGRPGTEPSVLLRAPTAIDASGRSQEPLYIIDGTILGSGLVDFDALDIESIEVVKGAAAASMYGSRAGAGVIQITTRRGRGIEENVVRYSLRSEFGRSTQPGSWDIGPPAHQYQMTPDGQRFIDGITGQPCEFRFCNTVNLAGQRAAPGQAVNRWNSFMDQPWPAMYNNLAAVFPGGNVVQQQLSAQGSTGSTNFNVGYSYLHDEGILAGQDGFRRHTVRLNLDQTLRPNFNVFTSTFISRGTQDEFGDSFGDAFFRLARMPRGVDIRQTDENGNLIEPADPIHNNLNPLLELQRRDWSQTRNRAMVSGRAVYSPLSWLSVEGDISYDRSDRLSTDFHDRGFTTSRPSPLNDGAFFQTESQNTAFNSSLDAVVRGQIGSDFAGRVRARWLAERQTYDFSSAGGYDLAAKGIKSLTNLQDPGRISLSQSSSEIVSEGVFLAASGDFRDRYIVDALVRRDGSSLFGSEQRWQTYYRLAGAWRVGEESWFNVPALNEFKLRYSYGTAGGRPSFAAQYETYNVSGGVVTPVTLGNRDLRPEYITEHEMGVDVVAFDRVSLMFNYVENRAEDQILPVPLPATAGFTTQWRNAGTLESNTVEASVEALIFSRGDFSWNGRVNFDRTRHVIAELADGVAPFFIYPGDAANMPAMFWVREGESLGTYYGARQARSCGDLAASVQPFCGSHFDVNDDGLLVYVGEGNDWRSAQWGTSGQVGGQSFRWGSPIRALGIDPITGELTDFLPLGSTTPRFSLGWSSTFNWRGLSLYGLMDWIEGHSVWSQSRQWAVFVDYAGMMDQTGRPENEKKPVGYYSELARPVSDIWVEDASFVKLREVALSYRVGRGTLDRLPVISGAHQVELSLTGRNLLTWTQYTGFDPDVGSGGGQMGSAALARFEGHTYPPFRTWTAAVNLVF